MRLPLYIERFVTIICVYTPTMAYSDADILSLYSDVRQSIDMIPNDDKIILLDDLNARVGKDSKVWSCLGSHEIGN